MAGKGAKKTFKWQLDFASRSKPRNSSEELASPPDFNRGEKQLAISFGAGKGHSEVVRRNDQTALMLKKSWNIALNPFKQIPANLMMMLLYGSSISIISVVMTGMTFIPPIMAMLSLGATFKELEGVQATGQKLVYILGNLVNLGLVLYRCHRMGLLPTHDSDWLNFVVPQQRLEYSGGGMSLL